MKCHLLQSCVTCHQRKHPQPHTLPLTPPLCTLLLAILGITVYIDASSGFGRRPLKTNYKEMAHRHRHCN